MIGRNGQQPIIDVFQKTQASNWLFFISNGGNSKSLTFTTSSDFKESYLRLILRSIICRAGLETIENETGHLFFSRFSSDLLGFTNLLDKIVISVDVH